MPTKSRIKDLKIGDVFSFFESGHPQHIVIKQTETKTRYKEYQYMGHKAEDVSRYSNRFILIFKHIPRKIKLPKPEFIKPIIKNTITGEKYDSFKSAWLSYGKCSDSHFRDMMVGDNTNYTPYILTNKYTKIIRN